MPLASPLSSPYVLGNERGSALIFNDIADGIVRQVEAVGNGVNEALFEPVIRLGVTGLSRAGKTVFITSLVANLMNRERMPGFLPAAEGRVLTAFLQPQPHDDVPRFDYESHLTAMTGPDPHWPQSTRAVSELRLSFRVKPGGLLSGMRSPRTVHLDIVDYPGEWLLDLGLLDMDYATWSEDALKRAEPRKMGGDFLAAAHAVDPAGEYDEATAKTLSSDFAAYLRDAREAGFSDCTPGRFLLPGEMAGSPALTFAPLPTPKRAPRGSLHREFERRFEAYKSKVVKPFFRDHFSRIDRQIVLVEVLGAIHAGPAALEDLRRAMAEILSAFRPGRNAWLTSLLTGRRVEKILFAATKADHLHHTQHPRLTAVMSALMREAKDRADFAGASTAAMSIAALRTTTEETLDHQGRKIDCVRGTLLDTGKRAAFYPGDLPEDPARLLKPARDGAEAWLDADYGIMRFAPAEITLKPGEGPPHIRLDRAAEFLLGDRL